MWSKISWTQQVSLQLLAYHLEHIVQEMRSNELWKFFLYCPATYCTYGLSAGLLPCSIWGFHRQTIHWHLQILWFPLHARLHHYRNNQTHTLLEETQTLWYTACLYRLSVNNFNAGLCNPITMAFCLPVKLQLLKYGKLCYQLKYLRLIRIQL